MYPWVLLIDVVTLLLGLQLFWLAPLDRLVTRARVCEHARIDTPRTFAMNILKSWLMAHLEALMFCHSDVMPFFATPRMDFQISLDPSSACSKSQVPPK